MEFYQIQIIFFIQSNTFLEVAFKGLDKFVLSYPTNCVACSESVEAFTKYLQIYELPVLFSFVFPSQSQTLQCRLLVHFLLPLGLLNRMENHRCRRV